MKRGRKSAASLAIAPVRSDSGALRPAADLTADEVDIWCDVIRCIPPDMLGQECVELLASYCRHAVSARNISKLVAEFKPQWLNRDGGLERLDKLLKARERESRALLAAARSLRLTPQSRYDPKVVARKEWGSQRSYYDLPMMDDFDDD